MTPALALAPKSDSMPTMNKMDWDEAKHMKYYKAKYGEKIDEYSEEE